jgi:acyl dehydratase
MRDEPLPGVLLPPVARTFTTQDLVRFAHGANDYARLHYDQGYARGRGFSTVIVHGALKATLMSQVVTDWLGRQGWVRSFRSEYRAPDLPGVRLSAGGMVRSVDVVEGVRTVFLDLWVDDEAGRRTTRGSATAVLEALPMPTSISTTTSVTTDQEPT